MASLSPMDCPSLEGKVSPDEWAMRVELAALYRVCARFGMTDLGGTHLSARVPGREHHFLINPYGVLFEEVTASSLVKVDVDGEIVLDNGFPVNPAGFTIHSAVHMGRPDVVCVAHTHTVAGIAVSCLKDGLLPLTQHSMRFYNRISYHDWEGPATNLDERERLVADLGPTNLAMILRNHGLLACGRSVAEAWKVLFYLEKSADSQLRAMAAAKAQGKPLVIPDHEVCEHSARQMEARSNTPAGTLDWPALKRLLDAADPTYKH